MEPTTMSAQTKMGLWVLGIIVVGVIAYFVFSGTGAKTPSITDTASTTNATSSIAIACTMDAKLCPDGSYVGRTGPKCQFICPTGTSTKANAGVSYPADILK